MRVLKLPKEVYIMSHNHCNVTQDFLAWADGELLGDGCLVPCSLSSARFRYSSKRLSYLQYVSCTLKSFGIEQTGKIFKTLQKILNVSYYSYTSRCYPELLPLRRRWYPEGKKVVPRDVVLLPITCRQWYIGDGTLYKTLKNLRITLSTEGFTRVDVAWLVKQLAEIGILATQQHVHNRITIASCSVKDFLNYTGESPVECYKYKWDI